MVKGPFAFHTQSVYYSLEINAGISRGKSISKSRTLHELISDPSEILSLWCKIQSGVSLVPRPHSPSKECTLSWTGNEASLGSESLGMR